MPQLQQGSVLPDQPADRWQTGMCMGMPTMHIRSTDAYKAIFKNKHIERQAGRQAGRQADRLVDRQEGIHIEQTKDKTQDGLLTCDLVMPPFMLRSIKGLTVSPAAFSLSPCKGHHCHFAAHTVISAAAAGCAHMSSSCKLKTVRCTCCLS